MRRVLWVVGDVGLGWLTLHTRLPSCSAGLLQRQHPFRRGQPSTTVNLLHSPVHPSLSMRVDCWGRSRQVSWALSCRNACRGGLEWFWPWRGGASPLIWCGSGLEETLFTFAQQCMVCSWFAVGSRGYGSLRGRLPLFLSP